MFLLSLNLRTILLVGASQSETPTPYSIGNGYDNGTLISAVGIFLMDRISYTGGNCISNAEFIWTPFFVDFRKLKTPCFPGFTPVKRHIHAGTVCGGNDVFATALHPLSARKLMEEKKPRDSNALSPAKPRPSIPSTRIPI